MRGLPMSHAPTLPRTPHPAAHALAVAIVVLALLGALMLTAPESALAFKSVERGDRGARVATVQRVLGIRADRHFGPATVRAVKRFQRSRRDRKSTRLNSSHANIS